MNLSAIPSRHCYFICHNSLTKLIWVSIQIVSKLLYCFGVKGLYFVSDRFFELIRVFDGPD